MSRHLPFFSEHADHEAAADALTVSGLCHHYGNRPSLKDVTFSINRGERVAVVGPNGAGKSTLFQLIAGILEPDAGTISIYGHRPARHFCIAYVVQRSQVDWSFPVTVSDVVMMGRAGEIGPLRRPGRTDREKVDRSLADVGLYELRNRRIRELSGGQQQRMFIARALAQEATLMLMDEPFNGLDFQSQRAILDIIDTLGERGVTILVATHDLDIAARRFERVLLLNTGMIGIGPAAELFTAGRIQAAFGQHSHTIQLDDGLLIVQDSCCSGGNPPDA